MSARKAVIGNYIEGFRRGDHAQVLGCLAEDIVWELYGHKTVRGKAAFAAEVQNDMFEGEPTLEIDRMVEEGDTVAVTGGGSVRSAGPEPFPEHPFAAKCAFVRATPRELERKCPIVVDLVFINRHLRETWNG